MRDLRNWCVVPLLAAGLVLAGCADPGESEGEASLQLGFLTVSAELPVLRLLDEVVLTATAVYEDGSTADVSDSVLWSSSDPEVADVSALGIVSGLAAGNATFTATDPETGIQASVEVQVTAPLLERLVVTAQLPILSFLGQTLLNATAIYDDGSIEDVSELVEWVSGDLELASISATGVLTGLAAGKVEVTAIDPETGIEGSVSVEVLGAALDLLNVTAELPVLALLGHTVLTATAIFEDGSTADLTGVVEWVSSDSAIATVSAAGLVTALSTGSITITAIDPESGMEGSVTIEVLGPILEALNLSVELPLLALLGETILSATAIYSDGSTLDVSHLVEWVSSDPEIASVSALGIVTGLSAGSVTISATDPESGLVGETPLTVLGAVLEALDVSVELPVLRLLGETVLTAIGTYSDGSSADLSDLVDWVSSDPDIAKVSALGIVTGLTAGSVTLSATDAESGVTGSVPLDVLGPVLEALDISAELPVLNLLGESQLTAIGSYSDGSSADLSGLVDWASSNPEIANVSALGLVTGLTAGSVTLTATDPETGVESSVTLDVLGPILEAIEISPGAVTIQLGQTVQFSATGHYSDGSTADLTGVVEWDTPGSLIDISIGGLVIALSLGGSDVTATHPASGLSAVSLVNVILF